MSTSDQRRNPGSADRGTAADRSTNPAVLSSTDRDFAVKAAQGGMAEVELGNLAQQSGFSVQIKNFGKKLVDDHTRTNNELKDIAAKQGIALPADVGAKQRQTIDKLSKLSGAQFDREFWSESVKDHREDISEFRKEVEKGENQALKDFASRSIPTLEDHLRMAENKGAK
jgi:putative membrane protein